MRSDRPGPDTLSAAARHKEFQALWGSGLGLRSLAAVNHTVIGLRFMVTAAAFFLFGGVLAMLIRSQLALPHTAWMDPATYSQVFTVHGVVMMFLFAIPMIEGFTLYILPKLLGARDLAFPRLSAFGYWCYLFGGSMIVIALLAGVAPDSGWFMYTPLSSKPYSPGINADIWLLGITFVEVSAVCAAVEFMVTVLKVRTAGMALTRMPILVWYLWVTAAMMLVGFPPLILGSVLLEMERAFGWPFFDPERGGSPLLWQHLFWLFGHPEVYIIFLPGAGIISTLIPVFAGRPLVGYIWIVAALVALGFLSFALWVHHMFTTGIPHLSVAFFSAASLLVVIPTSVQIFSWLATLLGGRPRLGLPMLYVYGFLFIFVAGGLTGVMVAVVPFDWQAHDTYFVVAHLHYVLVGGFVFPVLAGLYFWLPHLAGRRHLPGVGRVGFWLIFLGFNTTFLPLHLVGLLGMPRRVHGYPDDVGWSLLNLVSSIGGFVLAVGFAVVLVDVVLTRRFGRRTPRNPWGAGTLDWAMPTPPTAYNFASQPMVSGPDPLHADPALPGRIAAGLGALAQPRPGRWETLGVDPIGGRPDQVILLPGPSWIPLLTAVSAGVFFVSFLVKAYPLAVVGAGAVVVCGLSWLWRGGMRHDPDPVDTGPAGRLPVHVVRQDSPVFLGLVFTLAADATFFASLVFGHLFLWVAGPGWPPPATIGGTILWPVPALATLGGAAGAAAMAARRNRTADAAGRDLWTGLSLVAAAAATAALLVWPWTSAPAPTSHAYAATAWALCLYGVLHTGLGVVFAAYGLARARRGYVSARRSVEVRALVCWQVFTSVTGAVAVVVLAAPAWGGGG
ncbi:MAG: cytochrome c oxidase subunit 1 [Pseudomonadota bacterium]|jgi:cytochrome c oxidase subunit I+III